jgi:hypothetical protein
MPPLFAGRAGHEQQPPPIRLSCIAARCVGRRCRRATATAAGCSQARACDSASARAPGRRRCTTPAEPSAPSCSPTSVRRRRRRPSRWPARWRCCRCTNGWGALGRRVSLSPLEIAQVLRGPLLRRALSNVDAAQLAAAVRHDGDNSGAVGGGAYVRRR